MKIKRLTAGLAVAAMAATFFAAAPIISANAATPDGKSDTTACPDETCLINAIAGAQDGDAVWITGTIDLTVPVQLNGISLLGTGSATLDADPSFSPAPLCSTSIAYYGSPWSPLVYVASGTVQISDVTIAGPVGTAANPAGICSSASSLVLDRVNVTGINAGTAAAPGLGWGIVITGRGSANVTDTTIDNIGKGGIYMFSNGVLTLNGNNTITGTPTGAIAQNAIGIFSGTANINPTTTISGFQYQGTGTTASAIMGYQYDAGTPISMNVDGAVISNSDVGVTTTTAAGDQGNVTVNTSNITYKNVATETDNSGGGVINTFATSCFITFDANGGMFGKVQTAVVPWNCTSTLPVPATNPTRSGLIFGGWSVDGQAPNLASGTPAVIDPQVVPFDAITGLGTLMAIWTPVCPGPAMCISTTMQAASPANTSDPIDLFGPNESTKDNLKAAKAVGLLTLPIDQGKIGQWSLPKKDKDAISCVSGSTNGDGKVCKSTVVAIDRNDYSVTVTPPDGYSGNIVFQYTITSKSGVSASGLLTVVVQPTLTAPADLYAAVGSKVTIPLLGKDALPIVGTAPFQDASCVFVSNGKVRDPGVGSITNKGGRTANPVLSLNATFTGDVQLSCTVADKWDPTSNAVTVTIHVGQTAPVPTPTPNPLCDSTKGVCYPTGGSVVTPMTSGLAAVMLLLAAGAGVLVIRRRTSLAG